MTMRSHFVRAVLALGASIALGADADAGLVRIGGLATPDPAEIAAYDPVTNRLFVTSGAGVSVIELGNGTNLSSSAVTIGLGGLFGGNLRDVTSVAVDPNGRRFGVLTAIPSDSTQTVGKAVLFDTQTGAVLNELDVGFHPDMVTFAPDGTKILVANEGEAANASDAPGSISVIDVSGVSDAGQIGGLTGASVVTTDFSAGNLGPGVPPLSSLRINPSNAGAPENDIEPEYIAVKGDKAYVTLQEANAVGVYDLTTNTWEAIHELGTISQTIDASDRDDAINGGINIDDVVPGLPMPDAIGTFEALGKTFYVTANEGDARDGTEGFNTVDEGRAGANVDPTAGINLDNATGIGRLNISLLDGNTDGDVLIEVPTMFGTRSFSIWDAATGALVFDSGSAFETITAALVRDLYNSELSDPGEFDNRSDNKGPEPEGLVIGQFGTRTLAFIGLERTGGIMEFDITDPLNPVFRDYVNTGLSHGTAAPEGLIFIPRSQSPNGRDLLVVSYEEGGGVEVFQVVPEPGSAILLGLGGLGLLGFRGRRRGSPSRRQ